MVDKQKKSQQVLPFVYATKQQILSRRRSQKNNNRGSFGLSTVLYNTAAHHRANRNACIELKGVLGIFHFLAALSKEEFGQKRVDGRTEAHKRGKTNIACRIKRRSRGGMWGRYVQILQSLFLQNCVVSFSLAEMPRWSRRIEERQRSQTDEPLAETLQVHWVSIFETLFAR